MPELKKVRMGVGGSVNNGFTAEIERRVHDDGNAGALAKFIDEPPIERIDFLFDGLRTGAAVNVRDGGNDAAFSGRTCAVSIMKASHRRIRGIRARLPF